MPKQRITLDNSGLDHKSYSLLKSLTTPVKIQDFLNKLKFNFSETHNSVQVSLKEKRAHCFEAALMAAAALWINGKKPLILDLKAIDPDFDHVVALFKEEGCWGAISKTNHAVLRYREPVYKSVRELAMSYFHEYFLFNGEKTLREYSEPYDLSKEGAEWISTDQDLVELALKLDRSPHKKILTPKQIKNLRNADKIEIQAGKIAEYKKHGPTSNHRTLSHRAS